MRPYSIPDDDDALLAECDVETFRSGGPGGQHANKVESGVRLTHRPSGLVVTSRASRSQYRNKVLALAALREKLEAANRPRKSRIASRPTTASKQRRIEAKRRRAQTKSSRRKPPPSD